MRLKYIYPLLMVIFTWNLNAQKIKFKDENLKIALLELGYDVNKDNEIQITEIDTISKLKISNRNIKSLDDLVHFKKLKTVNAMKNQVLNLDVFFNNSTIEEIYVGENMLGKKLVIKNMPKLKGLYAFRNGLNELVLINTNNIESLYLQGNIFEKIILDELPKLKTVQLSENGNLKIIDVKRNVELVQLYLNSTKIDKLDISNNPLLKTLYIDNGVSLLKSEKQSNFKPMQSIKVTN
ncbi:leucine-rich repeat domain-containing protein [Flavobacterium branchiicola]|uniref:Leucine-rich repeat domain-containing protein n=1 Tax=Flavobacterium branchiicola TaxID=1114875 RepID=A0ABV9PND1_9FLAO|nr:hypothetical protein [Flavobacterium branchiicola]MBS7256516.1 hypothetical protein [Flavobacterium branchiicola]